MHNSFRFALALTLLSTSFIIYLLCSVLTFAFYILSLLVSLELVLPNTAFTIHCLCFLLSQSRSVLASVAAEWVARAYSVCPFSSPSFRHCQSTELTWVFGWAGEGWNFVEEAPANLAQDAAFPPNWNPNGWHCLSWEPWGPSNLPVLLTSPPSFQFQTLTPGGMSGKIIAVSFCTSQLDCLVPLQLPPLSVFGSVALILLSSLSFVLILL